MKSFSTFILQTMAGVIALLLANMGLELQDAIGTFILLFLACVFMEAYSFLRYKEEISSLREDIDYLEHMDDLYTERLNELSNINNEIYHLVPKTHLEPGMTRDLLADIKRLIAQNELLKSRKAE